MIMKLIIILLLCISSVSVFGQIIETAKGKVDLQSAVHYGGYLQPDNDSNPADRVKIIWYPGYNLYRKCNQFSGLDPVPVDSSYVNEECNCVEGFPYKFAPAAAAYANIQFEFDSSVLKPSSYPQLDATSAELKSNSKTIILAGYASSEGTAAHNMRLSNDRANAVKTYLVNSGVDARRLKVMVYGETHPIADNSTEDGRILNRRVEFH
jgi:outer membrane protein OmpA-like peptidoglycan-associated protein